MEQHRSVILLIVHSLVASCTCPDQRLNLKPWHTDTALQLSTWPGQEKEVVGPLTEASLELCNRKSPGLADRELSANRLEFLGVR